jgi:hypothetical protein
MGVMRAYTLRDKRGHPIQANVADSVNIDRTPRVRDQILAGEFHRVDSPDGRGRVTVEKAFFYSDFGRRQFFLVLPRWDRPKWQEASRHFREMITHIPETLAARAQRTMRVIFGLAELREKLIASDAGWNDQLVEALKVLAIYEHPHLSRSPRLNIVLDRVTDESVEFIAFYDHEPQTFRIGYARVLIDKLFSREFEGYIDQLPADVIRKQDPEPVWVNLRRWSSSNWAVGKLHEYARDIEDNLERRININSEDFLKMLQLLPTGSELSAAAKRDLDVLGAWAGKRKRKRKSRETLKEELWEIRFGKELRSEWVLIRPDVVDQLWQILGRLNPTQVEGNSFIDQIQLGVNEPQGFYNSSTEDIGIDRGSVRNRGPYDRAWFERVVLHEVGHGVHAQHPDRVNQMLKDWFGWERFPPTDAGIDAWVEAMGNYPLAISPRERKEIRSYIQQWVGEGNAWAPPPPPNVPQGHAWHQPDFGPRIACERTTVEDSDKRWYNYHARWHRFNGRCFFVNYWYAELMIVNERAINYVKNGVLDPYALMAPPEFFSELYTTANGTYPALERKRARLGRDIKQFLLALGAEPSAAQRLIRVR